MHGHVFETDVDGEAVLVVLLAVRHDDELDPGRGLAVVVEAVDEDGAVVELVGVTSDLMLAEPELTEVLLVGEVISGGDQGRQQGQGHDEELEDNLKKKAEEMLYT